MAENKEALKKLQETLKKRWEKNNNAIKKLVEIDEKKMIFNTQARKILQVYLDRFKKLAGNPPDKKNIREVIKLLDSLEYFIKIMFIISKKKRGRI